MKRPDVTIGKVLSYGIPLLLACFTATANYVIANDGAFHYRNTSFVGQVILFTVLFSVIFAFVERILLGESPKLRTRHFRLPTDESGRLPLRLEWHPLDVVMATVFILVLWLPYLYFAWPGIIWYDPASSTMQFLDPVSELNPANPLLVVCFIGAVIRYSLEAYGTYTVGVTMLICLQCLLTSLAFAASVCVLHRLGIARRWRLWLLLFLALFPFFPGIFVTLTKDTLSAAPTIAFSIMMVLAFREGDEWLRKPLPFLLTLLFALLTSATRLANLYMVIGSLFFYALSRPSAKKFLVSILLAATAFCCVNYLVPAVVSHYHPIRENAQTGSARAFAIQMVGNAARLAPEAFTEEDWKLIDKRFGLTAEQINEAYDYTIVDALVNSLHPTEEVPHPELGPNTPLRKVTLRALSVYPTACIGAWAGVTAQWFSYIQAPTLIAPSYNNVVPESFKELPGYTGEIRDEPFLRDINLVVSSLPGIDLLYSKALYATLIPCILLFMIARAPKGKKLRLFSVCVFVWLNCCYLLFCPTSRTQTGSRYLLPLICVLPVFGAYVIASLRGSLHEHTRDEAADVALSDETAEAEQ